VAASSPSRASKLALRAIESGRTFMDRSLVVRLRSLSFDGRPCSSCATKPVHWVDERGFPKLLSRGDLEAAFFRKGSDSHAVATSAEPHHDYSAALPSCPE
jgi:hypothetical protein